LLNRKIKSYFLSFIGKLSFNDQDMFVLTDQEQRFGRATDFEPLFIDEVEVNKTIIDLCKNSSSCIADVVLTGRLDIGLLTNSEVKKTAETITEAKKVPPVISFETNEVQIDWSEIQPVIIKANVVDDNNFDINFSVTDGVNYTTSITKLSETSAQVIITYTPKSNEYPVFE